MERYKLCSFCHIIEIESATLTVLVAIYQNVAYKENQLEIADLLAQIKNASNEKKV